jgi:hypothetical protein
MQAKKEKPCAQLCSSANNECYVCTIKNAFAQQARVLERHAMELQERNWEFAACSHARGSNKPLPGAAQVVAALIEAALVWCAKLTFSYGKEELLDLVKDTCAKCIAMRSLLLDAAVALLPALATQCAIAASLLDLHWVTALYCSLCNLVWQFEKHGGIVRQQAMRTTMPSISCLAC